MTLPVNSNTFHEDKSSSKFRKDKFHIKKIRAANSYNELKYTHVNLEKFYLSALEAAGVRNTNAFFNDNLDIAGELSDAANYAASYNDIRATKDVSISTLAKYAVIQRLLQRISELEQLAGIDGNELDLDLEL